MGGGLPADGPADPPRHRIGNPLKPNPESWNAQNHLMKHPTKPTKYSASAIVLGLAVGIAVGLFINHRLNHHKGGNASTSGKTKLLRQNSSDETHAGQRE